MLSMCRLLAFQWFILNEPMRFSSIVKGPNMHMQMNVMQINAITTTNSVLVRQLVKEFVANRALGLWLLTLKLLWFSGACNHCCAFYGLGKGLKVSA